MPRALMLLRSARATAGWASRDAAIDAPWVFGEPAPRPERSAATGPLNAMVAAHQQAVHPPAVEAQARKVRRPGEREQRPAGRPPERAHPPAPAATRSPPAEAAASRL